MFNTLSFNYSKRIGLFLTSFFIYSTLLFGQSLPQYVGYHNKSTGTTHLHQKDNIKDANFSKLPIYEIAKPDVQSILAEDELREKQGLPFRIGRLIDVNYTPAYSGVWNTLENGDKEWLLRIHSEDAVALDILFDHFVVYGKSYVQVYGINGKPLSSRYGIEDNLDHLQQRIEMNASDDIVIRLYQARGDLPAELSIEQIGYVYRGIANDDVEKNIGAGASDSCHNNINCPVAVDYQDEKKGVARIYIVDGMYLSVCTGSLVNNTANNCKPYFLTALHCGVDVTQQQLNNWKFNFNFEVASCNGTPTESLATSTNTVTGATKLATSNDGGGNSGSDFLLLQIGNNENNTINQLKNTIGAYWNGWDATGSAVSNGASIHHPAGDVKKISFFTSSLTTTQWNGNGKQSHWLVYWSDGVTEGGSSGSPIFTYNGGNSRIVGTLTGGSSYCSAPNSPDLYGKMSYHWDQNTTNGVIHLKQYLDPINNGSTKILDGSYDPCGTGGTPTDPDPEGCNANTQNCDEYIAQVILNTINNQTGCDNYSLYTTPTTTLQAGQTYDIGIQPGVVGEGPGNAYTGDIISAWIDYNGDGQFTANEKVYNIEFTESSVELMSTVTIPSNITPGTTTFRVRINYQEMDPCGTSEWGEVEDYKITLTGSGGGTPDPTEPCTANSQNCDEYIARVILNDLDNTSNCDNYTNYLSPTTTLQAGQTYDIGIQPGVVGEGSGNAYTGDIISAWIDYNRDGQFSNNERVYHVEFTGGQTELMSTVSVPTNVTPGATTFRVRINYQEMDPCGTSEWGEIEDYTITIANGGSSGVEEAIFSSLFLSPNPAQNVLFLNGDFPEEEYKVSVYDMTGKVVYKNTIHHLDKYGIDISNFAQGVYQLNIIQIKTGVSSNLRFIKE